LPRPASPGGNKGAIANFRGSPGGLGKLDEVKQILLKNCNDLGRDRYHQGAGMPKLMAMLTNT